MVEKRKSKWDEFVKERPNVIQRYNNFCNHLRLAFRPAQQEAMAKYTAQEMETHAQNEENYTTKETPHA